MANTIQTKGIITINGKQVENTFQNIQKEARSLERDLKKLTIGSDEYVKKWAELKNANKYLDEHKQKLTETKKAAMESGTSISGFFEDSSSNAKKLFSDILSGQMSFKTLGVTIKAFAVESWAALSSIPVIGWVAAIVGAVGLGVKEVIDYNNAIAGNIKKLDNLGIDQKIRPQIEAISGYFKVGFDEISNAVDQMLDLGIVKDAAEAVEQIKRGLVKAPDKSAFIASIEQTAETAKKLGMNLSNIIIIKEEIENRGLDGEKTFGSLNTAVNRILGNAEKLKPLLESTFGKSFANSLYQGVTSGTLEYGEALALIYKKGEEIGLSDKQRADIAKNLFGKSSASAYDYNNTLQLINESYRENYDELTKIQEKTAQQISLFEELAIEKDKALNSSSLRAFQRDMKEFWLTLQINFFKFLNWLDELYLKITYSQGYLRGMFLAIPEAAKAAFSQTIKSFESLLQTMESGGKAVWAFLTGDIDKANAEFTKFRNNAKGFVQDMMKTQTVPLKIAMNAGNQEGTAQMNNYIKNRNKKAAEERADEEAEARKKAGKSDFNDSNNSKKSGGKSGNNKGSDNSKEDLQKELDNAKDSYDKVISDILKAEYKLADEKFKIQKDSLEKDIAMQNQSFKEESDRLEQDSQAILDRILDLEKKKLDAKNPLAKAEYQKAIDKENELLKINNSIKEQIEQTHQFKLKTIREKWTAKGFEDFVKAEEAKINEERRIAEDKINDISTMEQAEIALSEMKYLKLTDQELKGIKTLEDAKRALRENADRAMMNAQLESLEFSKKILEDSLAGLTGEAAEKLKANLEELKNKITQVKSAIKGGNEQDSKKITEERKQELSQVDILGFSALQWQETFDSLDTTKEKLKAIGMAFQALSNAGQMFSELTRSLGERDLKNFERVQEKKKNAYTKQLNEGYITNEDYNKRIQKLERETANKKAELEYKQAKADKIARMFSIVGNTAVGISAALPNIPLAIVVGALGAVQLGIVAAQPLPEKQSFAEGGFTGYGSGQPDETGKIPAGIVHAREYVIPEAITMNPRYANVISWLESVRTGNAKVDSFADGGMVDNASASSSANTAPAITGMNYDADIKAFLQKNIELLEFLIENGVHLEESMQNARRLDKLQKEWNELTSKNKF